LLGGCIIFNPTNNWLKNIITAVILFHVAFLRADDLSPIVEFQLKPKLCVLSSQETLCNNLFIVEWHARQNLSVCIFRHKIDKPLECWDNHQFGNTQFFLGIKETTIFELREMNTQKIIATQQYDVVYEQKKYAKFRRNPWSFF
jgi:hypothetical protein